MMHQSKKRSSDHAYSLSPSKKKARATRFYHHHHHRDVQLSRKRPVDEMEDSILTQEHKRPKNSSFVDASLRKRKRTTDDSSSLPSLKRSRAAENQEQPVSPSPTPTPTLTPTIRSSLTEDIVFLPTTKRVSTAVINGQVVIILGLCHYSHQISISKKSYVITMYPYFSISIYRSRSNLLRKQTRRRRRKRRNKTTKHNSKQKEPIITLTKHNQNKIRNKTKNKELITNKHKHKHKHKNKNKHTNQYQKRNSHIKPSKTKILSKII